jgi:hypothetical protein
MRIELLNVGWMSAVRGIWRTDEEEPELPIRVPVSVYLIETKSERILVERNVRRVQLISIDQARLMLRTRLAI